MAIDYGSTGYEGSPTPDIRRTSKDDPGILPADAKIRLQRRPQNLRSARY
jgi:hypothetical protein